MIFATALLAVAMLAPQAGDSQTGFITVDKKPIPLRLTTSTAVPFPDGYSTWKGFAYLDGVAGAGVFEPYKQVSDWKSVADAYAAVKEKQGAIWKSKIVLFTRTEVAAKDGAGVMVLNRDNVYTTRTQEIAESIARAKAWIKSKTMGQVDFVPDVEVQTDIVRDPFQEATPFGPEFAKWFFGPRLNGGGYIAEDKIYRGPYNGAIYILPGYEDAARPDTVVNGTPVACLTYGSGIGTQYNPGTLEWQIIEAFNRQVAARVKAQTATLELSPAPDSAGWQIATSIDRPSTEVLVQRLTTKTAATLTDAQLAFPIQNSWIAQGSEVAFVDDETRGRVLKLTEKRTFRQGGIGLPILKDNAPIATVDAKPIISIWLKSTNRNPLSVRIVGDQNKTFWLSLGRNPSLSQPSGKKIVDITFDPNGQWQKLAYDLRPVAKELGITSISAVALEPSPDALIADLSEFSTAEYFVDEINFSATADSLSPTPTLQPSATATEPMDRAAFASQATATSPALIALIGDKDTIVRINAASAYQRFKDPLAVPALAAISGDINPAVQEAVLRALAFDGSEPAIMAIRQVLRFSPDEYAKSVAAMMLAQTGDAKYAGDILLLFTSQGWQPKIAAIDAVTKLDKIDPKFRLGFLRNDDPLVRLEVIKNADVSGADTLSAMEWHAVNDPSDLIRANAYQHLIASGKPEAMEQGYAGVRDDSKMVRIMVLDYMALHSSESDRKALQLAVADRSPDVRAAALSAYAKFPGEVTVEEIKNTFDDADPEVQLALLAMSKAKMIALPTATTDRMKASPDPRVVAAAG